MSYCNSCKHKGKVVQYCAKCQSIDGVPSKHERKSIQAPLTISAQGTNRADEIRGMSNKELARFIAKQRAFCCSYKDPSDEDYQKILEWLNSPVEEKLN